MLKSSNASWISEKQYDHYFREALTYSFTKELALHSTYFPLFRITVRIPLASQSRNILVASIAVAYLEK